jgi:hypothetical protein
MTDSAPVGSILPSVVPLKSLYFGFDVRRRLDPERVEFFRELIAAGAVIPPMLVLEKTGEKDGELYKMVDGRHRWAAYQSEKYEEVPVSILLDKNAGDVIMQAATANFGGPQPMSLNDIRTTVKSLVLAGCTPEWISTQLGPHLPTRTINTALDWTVANLKHQALRDARKWFMQHGHDGATYEAAAAQFDLKPDEVEEFITNDALSDGKAKYRLHSFAKRIGNLNKAYGKGVQVLLKELREDYDDNRISYEDCVEMSLRITEYRSKVELQCSAFRQRLERNTDAVAG